MVYDNGMKLEQLYDGRHFPGYYYEPPVLAFEAISAEEYGKYIIQGSGEFDYDENLDSFYDYAKFGAQQVKKQGGEFNALGYVAYKGAIPLEELISTQQAPEMGAPC